MVKKEEAVEEKSAVDLQAESEELKGKIAEHKANLAAENENLRRELEQLRKQSEKVKTCPGCGSDLHTHCALPAHHGGPQNVR